MKNRRPITRWNVLALLTLVIGGAATLGADQWRLHSWFNSGQAFPIGPRMAVELPAGSSHVYYESLAAVPTGGATLWLYDSEGNRVPVTSPDADINYRLLLSGWSGRALWKLDLPRTGEYSMICANHNFSHERDVPAHDRVVFARQPDSLDEMNTTRKIIQISGASTTIALVIVFYLMHAAALNKRSLPAV